MRRRDPRLHKLSARLWSLCSECERSHDHLLAVDFFAFASSWRNAAMVAADEPWERSAADVLSSGFGPEEHENGEALGDVVEGVMHASGNKDDAAGTDIESGELSVGIDPHFRLSAYDVVDLVLGVRFLMVEGPTIQDINPHAKRRNTHKLEISFGGSRK